MKRHLKLSTSTQTLEHATAAESHLTLASARAWRHTLILKGNLDECSAPELDDEIDCLREEGVSSLTLDLRQVEAIDADAMRVIASQQATFRSCGRRFAVLAEISEGQPRLLAAHAFGRRPGAWEMSTTMVRELGSED